tara:strand:+ start:662 stop:1489 length:828 start_codon:yes stop_codon:yes gene_type:complete
MARTEIELIKDGKVVRADLTDGLIDTSKLDTDAVTTIKIKDKQVTPAKLADSVSNTFFPIGGIILWNGAIGSIPSNFRLCDGQNGTPDLRDRFIVGAGAGYAPGDTGGSSQVTLTEAQLATHSHGDGTYSTDVNTHQHGTGTLSNETNNHSHGAGTFEASDNTHSHGITDPGHHHEIEYSNSDSGDEFIEESGRGKSGQEPTLGNQTGISINSDTHDHDVAGVSGSDSHSHTISGSTADHSHSHDITGSSGDAGSGQPHENRPPYYALAYIMKIS